MSSKEYDYKLAGTISEHELHPHLHSTACQCSECIGFIEYLPRDFLFCQCAECLAEEKDQDK